MPSCQRQVDASYPGLQIPQPEGQEIRCYRVKVIQATRPEQYARKSTVKDAVPWRVVFFFGPFYGGCFLFLFGWTKPKVMEQLLSMRGVFPQLPSDFFRENSRRGELEAGLGLRGSEFSSREVGPRELEHLWHGQCLLR